MYCYKRIRDLREDKDITQKEVADYLEYEASTICSLRIRRKRNPLAPFNYTCEIL